MDKIIVDEWLRYADNDLKAAHILANHHPMQLEIICYHCHQAAEKALKAFLLFSNSIPTRTHSLENLVDLCREITDEFDDIVIDCEYLNPFGVQPRYPFGLELSEDDAVISILKCENIVDFIRTRIIYESIDVDRNDEVGSEPMSVS